MKNSETHVVEVTERDIVDRQSKLDCVQLKTVKGTMKLHQIITKSPCDIAYRNISCCCDEANICDGHDVIHTHFDNVNELEEIKDLKQLEAKKVLADIVNKNINNQSTVWQRNHCLCYLHGEYCRAITACYSHRRQVGFNSAVQITAS